MVLEVEMIIEQLSPTAMLLWMKINGPWGLVQLFVWVEGVESASKVGATVVEVIRCLFLVEVENRAGAKQLIGCVCCSLLQVKAQG